MSGALQPVIVGAGPAGIRAAQALASRGLRPVVLDEGAAFGGQIYRRQPDNFRREAASLYGFEARRAASVHAAMEAMLEKIEYRPRTLAWNAEPGFVDVLHGDRTTRVTFTHLIIAAGATDRVLPMEGWTLPGVYTLGGAQVALKFQGCAIGESVVFAGSGPLLYLVAYQYAKAGARVAGVVDTATFGDKSAALVSMMARPPMLAKGAYYVAWLKAHGVAVHTGASRLRILGEDRVRGFASSAGELACDAVAIGHGLRPETQLADLLGCTFRFDAADRSYVPERDASGRTSVANVYVAGDGAGILGADAAEWAGERAALALMEDAGMPIDGARAAALERRIARAARFRAGTERAFPMPAEWARGTSDAVTICRCEEVTAGELRDAIRESAVVDVNRLKALTRAGMGRCQGRMCAAAASEILAHACGRGIGDVGRLRAQAPLKPIPFGVES